MSIGSSDCGYSIGLRYSAKQEPENNTPAANAAPKANVFMDLPLNVQAAVPER
jgi:hypothetical protein